MRYVKTEKIADQIAIYLEGDIFSEEEMTTFIEKSLIQTVIAFKGIQLVNFYLNEIKIAKCSYINNNL
jgi:hypothetical protein